MNTNNPVDLNETLTSINIDDDFSGEQINLSSDEQINPCYQKSRVVAVVASVFFTGASVGGLVSGEFTAKFITAYPIPIIFCIASYSVAMSFAFYSVAPCGQNKVDLI